MAPVKVAVVLVLLSLVGEGCSQRTGDLRLGGYGSTRYVGRVEMFVVGQWYAVCNDLFDFHDANVVCRQLGLGYPVILVNTDRESTGGRDLVFNRYGVEPNIIIGNVRCAGNESHILNCGYTTQHGCQRHEAIGVECSDYREQPYNGEVRLVGGEYPSEGRLEVFFNGQWGGVCSSGFDQSDGDVVCRQLGYTHSEEVSTSNVDGYVSTSTRVWLTNVACPVNTTQREFCLKSCLPSQSAPSASSSIQCSSGLVGLECGFNTTVRDPSSSGSKELCEVVNGSVPANGELRIVDGPTRNLGRVEVYLNEVWGTVCGAQTQFSRPSSEVICRQLGYKSWINVFYRSEASGYGSGDGPRHITRLNCSGGENTILDCYRENTTISPCGPADIMAIRCNTSLLLNPFGGMTLIGGSGGHGNLFIKEPRGFAPICDHTFGEKEGDVACRQMGYARAIGVVRNSYYAIGRLPAALSHIHCHGNETHLLQCNHRNDSKKHCDDYDQVGLQCSTDNDHREGGLRLVRGNSSAGVVELFLNGKWNRICSVNFKLPDAHVACRQLGFSGATGFYNDGRYGSLNSGILAMLGCHGSEETLFNCTHTPLHPLYCGKDIAVSCSLESICEEGSVRLTGGASNITGRLEVCEYGRWGSVCSHAFDDKDALVTCKQLGFYAVNAFTERGRIVPNDIPINIFASHCHGDEATLTSCEHEVSTRRCNHSLDVVLTCRECSLECLNGGVLNNEACTCDCALTDYTGDRCEVCEIECENNGTSNLGTCTCECPRGYSGKYCQICSIVDECRNNSTVIEEDCRCECTEDYTGQFCEVCNITCENGGTANLGNCTCTCPRGYSGKYCQTCSIADECRNNSTVIEEDCRCECTKDYTGQFCEDCAIECENGGTADLGTCTCTCPRGYSGKYCQICSIADECRNNSTVIEEDCRCECTKDYTGQFCEDCDIECENGATADLGTCSCTCPRDYSGKYCQRCSLECLNGGVLNNETCTCDCALTDYTGRACDVCAIIDKKKCENGVTPNSQDCTCECPSQYSGKYCQNCILECLNGGVLNNETCTCDCALADYTGDRCENCDIECENGGTADLGTCSCNCPRDYYSGKYCQSCSLECLNGGVLNNETCTCDCALTDYTEDRCQKCGLDCVNGGLDSGNCKCICHKDFTGKICNETVPTTTTPIVSGGAIAGMSVGIILLILLVLLMFAFMILVYALRRRKKRIESKIESDWIPGANAEDFAIEFSNPHYNDEHYMTKEDLL